MRSFAGACTDVDEAVCGQSGRAGEGVASSTGPANNGEALDGEVVGEREQVVCKVDEAPRRCVRRHAVAGPVDGDDADVAVGKLFAVPEELEAAPHEPVQVEDDRVLLHRLRLRPLDMRQRAVVAVAEQPSVREPHDAVRSDVVVSAVVPRRDPRLGGGGGGGGGLERRGGGRRRQWVAAAVEAEEDVAGEGDGGD